MTYAFQAVAHKGDHIVAAKNIYGGTYNLLAHTLPDYGIETTFVDPFDYEGIEAAIKENTTAIEIETLGNPNSEVVDIERIANIAHSHNIPLIVDNIWCARSSMAQISLYIPQQNSLADMAQRSVV